MTDLGRAMRDVAERTSAETVAPPFARIERRHRARRARQVALAGMAAVAVGGIAVAVPGLTRGGDVAPARPSVSLRSHYELIRDARGTAAVRACIDAAGFTPPAKGLPYLSSTDGTLMFVPGFPEAYDRCLVANGFTAFAVGTQPEFLENARRSEACGALLPLNPPVARGTHRGAPWEMRVAFEGDLICVRHAFDGWRDLNAYGNEERRSPAGPESRFLKGRTRGNVLLYGWHDARAARIDLVVNGVRHTTPAVRSGDVTFYALPLTLPATGRLEYTAQGYDANGERIGRETRVIGKMD